MTRSVGKLGAIVKRGGVEFRVWAPLAKHVAVAVPYISYDTSNQIAMERDNKGYWSVMVPRAEIGQQYKYIITTNHDEIIERNDPYARALTNSDAGASIITGSDFDWGDDIFMPIPKNEHIIYEMHVGTFHRRDASSPGTFYDAIEKLDYVQSLGVNMIELMPVTSMCEGNGWGYNVNHIFAVEQTYGGRHGLMSFVRACHERGIGVIADVVYNHFCNAETWAFDGTTPDLPGGQYFSGDERNQTPWGARPDYTRKEVRQFILDSVAMWFMEYRLDGLRLDSTSYLRNLDGGDALNRDVDGAWSLLQDITSLAHRLRPGSVLIAEDTGSNDFITLPRDNGGAGFDAQWRLMFPEALYQALGIAPRYPVDIKDELTQRYTDDAFTRIVFSDSHDTAANGRARLNEIIAPRHADSLKAKRELLLASTVTLTSPGIPMLLQGQEFIQDGAFNNWQDLDWENVSRYEGIVNAHRDIIALRKNDHGISRGLTGNSVSLFHINDADRILAYHRWHRGGPSDDVIVIINFGSRSFPEYKLSVPVPGQWQVRFNSSWRGYDEAFSNTLFDTAMTSGDTKTISISLAAYSALILSQNNPEE